MASRCSWGGIPTLSPRRTWPGSLLWSAGLEGAPSHCCTGDQTDGQILAHLGNPRTGALMYKVPWDPLAGLKPKPGGIPGEPGGPSVPSGGSCLQGHGGPMGEARGGVVWGPLLSRGGLAPFFSLVDGRRIPGQRLEQAAGWASVTRAQAPARLCQNVRPVPHHPALAWLCGALTSSGTCRWPRGRPGMRGRWGRRAQTPAPRWPAFCLWTVPPGHLDVDVDREARGGHGAPDSARDPRGSPPAGKQDPC
ncbi:unnamed protein product [Nyctereutes procyonoides]|uniref:(raccoon dog) hypothetical protein n=1 Tax=Nyctereutes procyonoides TaxID=34880 RepID=A0A811Z015_NYCPR|nr:unnamed protein product [Nyctereutes procyonoides]